MRQYIYSAKEAGLDSWPSGELRLSEIEITKNPNEAAIFVCPGNIRIFEKSSGVLDIEKLNKLPYFKGNEARTVLFDVSDNFKKAINLPVIFIRCDVRTWMLPNDPNTLSVAWPVENFEECVAVPEEGFKFHLSFQGWLSSDERKQSVEACRSDSRLHCDIAGYQDFCGYIYHEAEGIRRRREFRRSMRESRITLCPSSIDGVFPYRYWESLSAGRVALLVGSDFVYPFADEIDYSAFTITCPREEAHRANQIALNFFRSHSDSEIAEMGLLARAAWERWLDSRKWPELMSYAVRKHIETQCSTIA